MAQNMQPEHQAPEGETHQRHHFSLGQRREQLRPLTGGVVVVIGDQPGRNAVAVGEHPGDTGILARHQVGRSERRQSAHRDVAKIADRGSDHIESGSEWPRGDRVAIDGKA